MGIELNDIELKNVETKNIYGVIYKGKEYTVNLYYSTDNCGDYEMEIWDNKGNELNDKKLKKEIEKFVLSKEEEEQ